MKTKIKRVVTGYNHAGKSVLKSDSETEGKQASPYSKKWFWATHNLPVIHVFTSL